MNVQQARATDDLRRGSLRSFGYAAAASADLKNFGWADNWMTFLFAEYHDPEWIDFGPLRVTVEDHIQPHSGFPPHPHRDVEIVT